MASTTTIHPWLAFGGQPTTIIEWSPQAEGHFGGIQADGYFSGSSSKIVKNNNKQPWQRLKLSVLRARLLFGDRPPLHDTLAGGRPPARKVTDGLDHNRRKSPVAKLLRSLKIVWSRIAGMRLVPFLVACDWCRRNGQPISVMARRWVEDAGA